MPQSEPVNINDTFFSGHYKEVWRQLIPPGLSEAECGFIEDVGALKKGDAVLDLMCGYGRHALELGRRGYTVTAVDNSQDYIAEINATAKAENLPVKGMAAGALEIALSGHYKMVICMGNSFAFFAKNDAQFLLKKIAELLQPGGVFLINTWMIAEVAIRHFKEREWHHVGNFKYLLDYSFQFQPSRIESEHTLLLPDGGVEVIKGVDYIFTLGELEAMFWEAGLSLKNVYSTPKKRKFRMGDKSAYVVAEKNR